jgi:hypothetical protein
MTHINTKKLTLLAVFRMYLTDCVCVKGELQVAEGKAVPFSEQVTYIIKRTFEKQL